MTKLKISILLILFLAHMSAGLMGFNLRRARCISLLSRPLLRSVQYNLNLSLSSRGKQLYSSSSKNDMPAVQKKKQMKKTPKNIWEESLKKLKGVGPKTLEHLQNLDIHSVGDLLLHFPSSVIDRRNRVLLHEDLISTVATVELVIDKVKEGGFGSPYVVTCHDNSKTRMSITYFFGKSDFGKYQWLSLSKIFIPGEKIIVSGKLAFSSYTGAFDMVNPEVALSIEATQSIEKALIVEPVYGLTAGLSMTKLKSAIKAANDLVQESSQLFQVDWMSDQERSERGWMSMREAFNTAHNPQSHNDLYALTDKSGSKWRERLAYDELVALSMRQIWKDSAKKQELEKRLQSETTLSFQVNSKGERSLNEALTNSLPFKLTSCQDTVISEILKDMQSEKRMVRCVQGDVGSGKTLVAIAGMLHTVEGGRQAALLAPTEILASQHHEVIKKHLSKIRSVLYPIDSEDERNSKWPQVRLITGAVRGKSRDYMLEEISSGKVDIVVGTHALLTEAVADSIVKLGLVVIDEEQRFGVAQRDALAGRTNTLYTTATPIPRSLMMLVQEGYSVSTLTEKPPAKRPIQTVLIGSSLTQKVMDRISANICHGTKVFWVTPCLEPSSTMPGSSVLERHAELSAAFPGKVSMLHGRMSSEDKNATMSEFSQKNSDISILVSTTVVEVGVDVPDASICVIDRAEHFGLSQVHQIRGRIGRGEKPEKEILDECYCVLLYNDASEEPVEKLKILSECNDGFKIAESDLKLRGPGDIFGLRQHGDAGYKVADLLSDTHLLLDAQRKASQLLNTAWDRVEDSSHMGTKELLDLFSGKGENSSEELLSPPPLEYRPPNIPTPTIATKPPRKKKSKSVSEGKDAAEKPAEQVLQGSGELDADTADEVGSLESSLESLDYLDFNNDPLFIMREIGVDRDEGKVKAWQEKEKTRAVSGGTRSKSPFAAAKFLSKPVVDFTKDEPKVVILDLETTGLKHQNNRIIQIAAKVLGDENSMFNAYVNPVGDKISPFIAQLTGIEQAFVEEMGMPFEKAWLELKAWLLNESKDGHVVLLAHNGRRFDYDFITAEVQRHGCDSFDKDNSWLSDSGVSVCVDSLDILKNGDSWAPGEKPAARSFSQTKLYVHVLGREPENSHNAMMDILQLEEILTHESISRRWINVANEMLFTPPKDV